MRRRYLVWGLTLTLCPALVAAAELAQATGLLPQAAKTSMELAARFGRIAGVTTVSAEPSLTLAQATDNSQSPVVTIDAFRELDGDTVQMSGTGVLVSQAGYIYAPYFLAQRADGLVVTFSNGQAATARLVAGDKQSQLAVLKTSEVPDGIRTPELGGADTEQAGHAVSLVQLDEKHLRVVPGEVVTELDEAGPLHHVLEVQVSAGSEVKGGILLDGNGSLVGLALATAASEKPGRQSVIAVGATRIRQAVGRMQRGGPGVEAPRPKDQSEI